MHARVIGVGTRAAGDDGVGLAVLDALRDAEVPSGVELRQVSEPLALVELLDGAEHVVLVDAVLGAGATGEVLVLRPSALAGARAFPLSSHGVSVATALALSRSLGAGQRRSRSARDVWIVAVRIGLSLVVRGSMGLSPAVTSAVPRAVEAVLERLRSFAR